MKSVMSQVQSHKSHDGGLCLVFNDRLVPFVESLEKAYNLTLKLPRFESVVDIKKFCSGLLEGQIDHPWRASLSGQQASSVTRMSIAHSLFLFRKLIPSEKPSVVPYLERMCSPQEKPSTIFLEYCRSEVRKLFPYGWDRSYQDKVTTATLPLSSCSENGRKDGGCRGLTVQARWEREDFCTYVSESVCPRQRGASRVQAIETGGKWRIISIPPRVENALRPLHQCLYDKVSQKEWCLRGDAKPSRFKNFTRVEGEIFVSGDYESATDNLNSEVQLTILSELLVNARSVPDGIKRHALSTFSSLLEDGEGFSAVQQRGQLMGQLLSFPLLCLVNYLTFKFLVPRDVPVRINGDDIVFRATTEEFRTWSEGVGSSGLVLSAGKTFVHRRFFSLNSAMFDAGRSRVRWVPFVRPKCVWDSKESECEKIASLSSRFYSMTCGFGKRRAGEFRRLFLRENLNTIYRCRRSLTRGMGMSVSEGMLRDCGLWNRELFYLEQDSERPLPSFSYSQYKTNDIPSGWTRVSPHWYPREVLRGWEFRLSHLTVRNAWERPVLTDSIAKERWMADCDAGCSTWGLSNFVNTRMLRLTGLSRRDLWRWVCLRRNRDVFGRVRFGKGVGMPKPSEVLNEDFVTLSGEQGSPKLGYHAVPPPSSY